MSKLYQISIVVDRSMADTVIKLLVDYSVALSMKEYTPPNGPARVAPATKEDPEHGAAWRERYFLTNPNAQKAIVAILNAMKPGKDYHYKDLGPAIVPVGFNAKSITPMISWLAKNGRIVKGPGRGLYRLPEQRK